MRHLCNNPRVLLLLSCSAWLAHITITLHAPPVLAPRQSAEALRGDATGRRALSVSVLPTAATAATAPAIHAVTVDPPSEGAKRPFLGIGIPTVPRQGRDAWDPPRYLDRSLNSIIAQVNGTHWEGNVAVWVMNMRPGEHTVFESCREKWGRLPWLHFVENRAAPAVTPQRIPDAVALESTLATMQRQALGVKTLGTVQRQALDMGELLKFAAGKSSYYLFTEDDFQFCENTLMALGYAIERAEQRPAGWSAIRCSFGFAGIVMHNAGRHGDDLRHFTSYMYEHRLRRPPDLLAVEWALGETAQSRAHLGKRRMTAFRYNVLNHIGTRSSVRPGKKWGVLTGCFATLSSPPLFKAEVWKKDDCPNDDMWPCHDLPPRASTLSWSKY